MCSAELIKRQSHDGPPFVKTVLEYKESRELKSSPRQTARDSEGECGCFVYRFLSRQEIFILASKIADCRVKQLHTQLKILTPAAISGI